MPPIISTRTKLEQDAITIKSYTYAELLGLMEIVELEIINRVIPEPLPEPLPEITTDGWQRAFQEWSKILDKYMHPEIITSEAIPPGKVSIVDKEHPERNALIDSEAIKILPPVNASQVSSFYPGHEPKNIYQQKERGHKPPINREAIEMLNGKYVNIYYNGFGGGQAFRKGWLIVEGDWCYLYHDKEAKGNPGEHHAAFYLVENEITLIEESQPILFPQPKPTIRPEQPYY